jgi:hypothetical protein
VARVPGPPVLVEVKTVTGGDPFLHVDPAKERTLARLASRVGARRIDVVGIVAEPGGLTVHVHHGW